MSQAKFCQFFGGIFEFVGAIFVFLGEFLYFLGTKTIGAFLYILGAIFVFLGGFLHKENSFISDELLFIGYILIIYRKNRYLHDKARIGAIFVVGHFAGKSTNLIYCLGISILLTI